MGRALFSQIYTTTAPSVHAGPEPTPTPSFEKWSQWNAFDPDSDEFFNDAEYEAFLDSSDATTTTANVADHDGTSVGNATPMTATVGSGTGAANRSIGTSANIGLIILTPPVATASDAEGATTAAEEEDDDDTSSVASSTFEDGWPSDSDYSSSSSVPIMTPPRIVAPFVTADSHRVGLLADLINSAQHRTRMAVRQTTSPDRQSLATANGPRPALSSSPGSGISARRTTHIRPLTILTTTTESGSDSDPITQDLTSFSPFSSPISLPSLRTASNTPSPSPGSPLSPITPPSEPDVLYSSIPLPSASLSTPASVTVSSYSMDLRNVNAIATPTNQSVPSPVPAPTQHRQQQQRALPVPSPVPVRVPIPSI